MSSWIYDRFQPPVRAGQMVRVQVDQTLMDDPSGGQSASPLLHLTGARTVHFRAEGPRTGLAGGDIVGVYPAAGSLTSPANFLPHIALRRRTLPWERFGPQDQPTEADPWLFLLLLQESELQEPTMPVRTTTVAELEHTQPQAAGRLRVGPAGSPGLASDRRFEVVDVERGLLASLLHLEDLVYLCHGRRVSRDEALAATDDDNDVAVVIGSRLPNPRAQLRTHHAFLVSLEGREDLRDFATADPVVPLIVLHHWSFSPTPGGDFEQVAQSIRVRPNGGVLRFGNLPAKPATGGPESLSGGFASTLDASGYLAPRVWLRADDSEAEYRGPLRPFEPGPRSQGLAIQAEPESFAAAAAGDPRDYSHACAFEIGRLLMLSDATRMEQLREVKVGPVAPVLPDIPDEEIPAKMLARGLDDLFPGPEIWNWRPGHPLIRPIDEILDLGQVDFTGIAEHPGDWKAAMTQAADDGQLENPQTAAVGELFEPDAAGWDPERFLPGLIPGY